MKRTQLSILGLSLLFCLSSCDINKNNEPEPIKKEKFTGYVQKGPFVNGSSVTISELDNKLDQTGRSYSTTVANNAGNFEQKNIELVSDYVQLKADGYYFNEVTGKSSSGQLTLYALADISEVNSANINVLTHLEKSRVEYLVLQKGMTFAEAKKQAQTEVLNIFSLSMPNDSSSEKLNLSGSGENNGVLLAVSCILQGQLSTGDMSELMGNIISDIKTDGKLDDASLGSALIDNARLINLGTVRSNLETKYAQLGAGNVAIPNFEKYVQEFMSKTTYTPVKLITYPQTGNSGLNILSDSVTTINDRSKNSYSMTANLPEGTSLRVVIKGGKWYYNALPAPLNWKAGTYNETTKTQEFNVIESNTPNDITVMFDKGTVTIEIYENGATTPTRTKQLTIGNVNMTGDAITYPATCKNTANILSDSVTYTRPGKIYSLRALVPLGKTLKIVIFGKLVSGNSPWVCVNNPAPENWTIGTYNAKNRTQEFTVTESNKDADMGITFTETGAAYQIEYYENGAVTPTKTRIISQ